MKNALHEILGTAGQVIFSRACRLVGADAENLATTTPEQLQKAAISIISPALRLCRGEQMIKNLQERIRSICASVGEISPELEDALNGSGKTIAVVSSTSVTSKNHEPVATVPTEQTVQNISEEEKKEEITTPVPTIPEEEIAKADTSDIDTEEDEEAKEEEEKEETSTEQPSSAQDDKQADPKDDDSADASTAEETKEEATSEEEPEEEPELSIFAHYDYEDSDTEEEAAEQNSAVSSSDEQTEANKEQTQEVATEQDTESAEEAKSEAVQQSEAGEVVEKAEDNSDTHENLDKGSSKSSKSVGDQLVRNTEVPNRTLSDKRAQEFNTTFKIILDGTQTKFQDHVVDLIYKMTWTPSQISERDRACTRPKQINKLSQSIIRSSVDFDLDQIIEWLNYLVMPKRINTYVPEERLAQLSNIRTRQDSEVQDLLNIIEALNKRIFRKDRS